MFDLALHLDERATAPGRTPLWVPMLLWCLIMATFAQFRERSITELFEPEGFDAQVKFQAATWMGLGCLAICLLAIRRADLRLVSRGPLFWYCCFVIAALISSIYSPVPALSAYRSLQHAVALVLVISLREHLQNVYHFIVAFVAVNWVLVMLGLLQVNFGMPWIANPAENITVISGSESVWRLESAFGHPSFISVVAACGAAGLAYRARGRQWLVYGPIIVWLVLTTVLTLSRTAIVGLIGGLAVAALGRRVLLPWVCLIGVVAPLTLLSPDVQKAVSHRLSRGQSTADLFSLTGRIPAYREAWQRIDRSWPLGQGFQVGRVQALDPTGENVGVAHAHNLLLECLLSLGFLGSLFAMLFLLSLLATVWSILRRDDAMRCPVASAGWELAAMLVPLYAFCVLDSGFVAKMDPVVMLFLVVASRAQTVLMDSGDETTREPRTGGRTCPT